MTEKPGSPILGLDIGEVRIGVALSDPFHLIAQSQGVFPGHPRKKGLQAVVDLVREKQIGVIVVGHPKSLRGRQTDSTERSESFAAALQELLPGVKVELWDERLTTVQAIGVLREGSVRGKKQKMKVDQVAAALILQNYLDCHHFTKRQGSASIPETYTKENSDEIS